jgi:hypothetical protein
MNKIHINIELDPQETKDKLLAHCEAATKIVQSWPKWKRDALGMWANRSSFDWLKEAFEPESFPNYPPADPVGRNHKKD